MTLLLLDTNAYLRLAKRIKPLLDVAFGQKRYRLTILAEVEHEYQHSPRMREIFPWFWDEALAAERLSKRTRLTADELIQLDGMTSVLHKAVRGNLSAYKSAPSPVDCRMLAFGLLKEATVVTDDLAMHQLGKEFDIPTMHGHELLRRMLSAKMVSREEVRDIYRALAANGDLPASWLRDRDRFFPRVFDRHCGGTTPI